MKASKLSKRPLFPGQSILRKENHKFQFFVTVLRIHQPPQGEFIVKWSRGSKSAQTTKLINAEVVTRLMEVGQTLEMLCTLSRSKSSQTQGTFFLEKDFKLSLVSNDDKTIVKTHFDIARYVGVPSSDVTDTLKLGLLVKVELRFQSRMVKHTGVGTAMSNATSMTSDPDSQLGDMTMLELHEHEDTLDLNDLLSPVTPSRQTNIRVETKLKQFNETAESIRTLLNEEQRKAHELEGLFSTFKNLFSTLLTELRSEGEQAERAWVTYREVTMSISELRTFQASLSQDGDKHGPVTELEVNGVRGSQQGEGQCCDCSTKVKVLTDAVAHGKEQISALEAENVVVERRRFVLNMEITEFKQQLEGAKQLERDLKKEKAVLVKRVEELNERQHHPKQLAGDSAKPTANQQHEDHEKRVRKEKEMKKVIQRLESTLRRAQSSEKDYSKEVSRLTSLSTEILRKLNEAQTAIEERERGENVVLTYKASENSQPTGSASTSPIKQGHGHGQEASCLIPLTTEQVLLEEKEKLQHLLEEKEEMIKKESKRVQELEEERLVQQKSFSKMSMDLDELLGEKQSILLASETKLEMARKERKKLEDVNRKQEVEMKQRWQDIAALRDRGKTLELEINDSNQLVSKSKEKAAQDASELSSLRAEVLSLKSSNASVEREKTAEVLHLREELQRKSRADSAVKAKRRERRDARDQRQKVLLKDLEGAKMRLDERDREFENLTRLFETRTEQTNSQYHEVSSLLYQGIEEKTFEFAKLSRSYATQLREHEVQTEMVKSLRQQLTESSASHDALTDEFSTITSEFDKLQTSVCSLSLKLDEREAAYALSASQREALQITVEKLDQEVLQQRLRIQASEQSAALQEKTLQRNGVLTGSVAELNGELGLLRQRYAELEDEFSKVTTDLDGLRELEYENSVVRAELSGDNEQLRERCSELESVAGSNALEMDDMRRRLGDTQSQTSIRLEREREMWENSFGAEMMTASRSIHGLEKRVASAEKLLHGFQSKHEIMMKTKGDEQEEKEMERQLLEGEVNKLKAEIDVLQKSLWKSKETERENEALLRREIDELRKTLASEKTSTMELVNTITSLREQVEEGERREEQLKRLVERGEEEEQLLHERVCMLEAEMRQAAENQAKAMQTSYTELASLRRANEELMHKSAMVRVSEESAEKRQKEIEAKSQAEVRKLRVELAQLQNELQNKEAEMAVVMMDKHIAVAEIWEEDAEDADEEAEEREAERQRQVRLGQQQRQQQEHEEAALLVVREDEECEDNFDDDCYDEFRKTTERAVASTVMDNDGMVSMLVETKMKLAVAEEAKVQLEHLIHRLQEGDDYMRKKIADYVTDIDLILAGRGVVSQLSRAYVDKAISPNRPAVSADHGTASPTPSDTARWPFRDDGRRWSTA